MTKRILILAALSGALLGLAPIADASADGLARYGYGRHHRPAHHPRYRRYGSWSHPSYGCYLRAPWFCTQRPAGRYITAEDWPEALFDRPTNYQMPAPGYRYRAARVALQSRG